MRINHNIASLNTYNRMAANNANSGKSLEKLSSGLRINRAGDDAAGLAISEKMRGQIRGLDQASRNAQDSISLIQTAEGALNETHSILQRMRELAVQASNDTSTDSDRAELQKEVAQLKSEVDRIASTTEFNSKKLLNGSLTAAKAAQGTVANSAKFDVADVAASGGTSQSGLAIAISDAAKGQNGTGYSIIGSDAVAERTIIQTGVNDMFDITINGNTYGDVKIAASTTEGYTREQFVEALNTAIKDAVETKQAGASKDQFNQAVVSLTSDKHLKITTAAAGNSNTIKVSISAPTVTAANAGKSALQALGVSGKATSITGTADLRAGITAAQATAANLTFAIGLGDKNGASKINIDLVADGGLVANTAYSLDQIKTAMQTALDKQVGQGAITVGSDSNGQLTLKSKVGTATFKVEANGTGHNLFFNGIQTATQATISGPTNVKGTNTVNEVKAGTVVSQGANDQFNISVDGAPVETLTLKAGNYASRSDLVTEINNQINSNENLVGKVRAQLASDNSGKIEFVSNSTGASSAVTVSSPISANQSALGVLGYAGSAGAINGTVDISGGVDLTTAGDTKLTVVLGNKTATLDIKGYEGINTDTTAAAYDKTSRDAVVKALQAEFNKAFGEGAVTVNTSTTAAGADTLVLTTNSRAATFTVKSGGAMADILGGAVDINATVSPTGTNVETHGADAIDNTLSSNTKLTDLSDADGNKLGLNAGNVIKVTGTQNGKAFEASVTVTADSEVSDILNAMRNLGAFQGATVSLDTTTGKISVKGIDGKDKDISNLSFTAQKSATNTTKVADFNKMFGAFTETQKAQNKASDNSLIMHIGANEGQTLNVDINDMGTQALRIQDIDVSTAKGAQTAISVVNNALEMVSAERSKLGAYQNRLEHTINNLGTSSENLTASESRIRDVDMAKEMMDFQKNNILSQAAQAMLAQANQQPQGVLQLLRG